MYLQNPKGVLIYYVFIPISYMHLQNSNRVVSCDIFQFISNMYLKKSKGGDTLLSFIPMSYLHLQNSDGVVQ